LSFGVDNLFDKAYYQPLGGVYLERYAANNYSWGGINMSIPGPGRSVNAGLTVRF
jgi:iron complex outermembrane receptor protein